MCEGALFPGALRLEQKETEDTLCAGFVGRVWPCRVTAR